MPHICNNFFYYDISVQHYEYSKYLIFKIFKIHQIHKTIIQLNSNSNRHCCRVSKCKLANGRNDRNSTRRLKPSPASGIVSVQTFPASTEQRDVVELSQKVQSKQANPCESRPAKAFTVCALKLRSAIVDRWRPSWRLCDNSGEVPV